MKRQAISVLSLFVFAGCKPSVSEGRLASLDNFAGTGNKKINICSGNARTSTVLPSIEMSADSTDDQKAADLIKDATLHALSAVPDQIMTLFASQDKSVIRISNDVETFCKKQLSGVDHFYAGEGGTVQACWDTSEGRIAIYLKADPVVIQHHLVRMLARATSEVIAAAGEVPVTRSKAGYAEFVRRTENFQKFKFDLSSAFIKEVEEARAKGEKVSLDPYASLLSAGNASGRKLFDHFVYAESFDSYYCSAQPGGTRDTFRKDFPKTYGLFASSAQKIENDQGFLAEVKRNVRPRSSNTAANSAVNSSGFNLGYFDWVTPSWWSTPAKNVDATFKAGRDRAKMYDELSRPNSRVNVSDISRLNKQGLQKSVIIMDSNSNNSSSNSSKQSTSTRSWFPWW
jgi:hypothetical protein